MKIERLEVPALLHFAPFHLDFKRGKQSLHVIYGPNEAGKSTLLKVLLDLLFGGEVEEDFKASYGGRETALRGVLCGEGQTELVILRKIYRKQLRLFDTDRHSAAQVQRVLDQWLGQMDRERFQLFFGFNHERLRQGGESLLRADGQAEISLFEAASGLTSLQSILQQLGEQTKELFDPSWRKNSKKKLNQAWQNYKEQKEAVRKTSLRADHWQEMNREILRLEQEIRLMRTGVEEKRAQVARLQRVLRVRGVLLNLRETQKAVQALGTVTEFAKEADHRIEGIVHVIEESTKQLQSYHLRLEQERDEYKSVHVNRALLQWEDAIEGLQAELSRYAEALREVPNLHSTIKQMQSVRAQLAQELAPDHGLEEVVTWRIAVVDRERIKQLADDWQEIDHKLQRCLEDLQEIESEHQEIQLEMSQLGGKRDISILRTILEEVLGHGELEEHLHEMQGQIEKSIQSLTKKLRQQQIWQGGMERLHDLSLPLNETREVYLVKWDRMEQEIEQRVRDELAVQKRLADLNAELTAFDLAGHIPDESELYAVRERRNQGWRLIKKVWLESFEDVMAIADFAGTTSLAQAFEAAMMRADETVDVLWREVKRVASRAELVSQKVKQEQLLDDLQKNRRVLEEGLEDLKVQWEKEWEASGIKPKSPREMKEWISDHYNEWLKELRMIQSLQADQLAIEQQLQTDQNHLRKAISAMDDSLEGKLLSRKEAMAIARQIVETAQGQNHKWDQLSEQQLKLAKNHSKVQQQQVIWLQKQKQGESEYEQLRVHYPFLPMQVSRSSALLERLGNFFSLSSELKKKQEDLTRIEEICADFERTASYVAKGIQEEVPDDIHWGSWVRLMGERLKEARNQAARSEEIYRRLQHLESVIASAKQDLQTQKEQLARELGKYACKNLGELLSLIDKWRESQELSAKQEALLQQLYVSGDGMTKEALEEEMVLAPAYDLIQPRIDTLESEIARQDDEIQLKAELLGKKRRDFAQMDGTRSDAALHAQTAEFYLTEVDRYWNEYLRAELARRFLQHAMGQFREQNESGILQRASEFFSRLTLGKYAELQVEYEQEIPYLLAIAKDGARRKIGQMSDGTRDQLFLALRLAFVWKHLTHVQPMPLIMDDILVHFDDERTAATLELLAEFAEKTQILYFTHQQSIVQMIPTLRHADVVAIHSLVPHLV
ncbi:AAA family ATPase [Sulfoacidibacillus thermotolerans]|uniref:YhaN AAA domain-containing protein n=1 Tax=Sulfoacidibacillus thermotolerans TaxID=1765684 RepID=A0A2U3D7H3_SULT2|nr:AAA family ATPase [Sulfoacidibacillus thermotolerans]PWI57234.1 hypothetical protein BM613_09605 [Sulfoacidibacillus thermotolerans]